MEKYRGLSDVACPSHPSFPIQLVHMEDESDNMQFLCTQCTLELKDFSIMSKMKSITELITRISKINLEKKESLKLVQKPVEYLDLLSGQAEIIDEFSKHVEDEKKKTSTFFDLMAQKITNLIMEKKKQYFKELDEQVDKLRSYFAPFEKQLKKAFPADEDFSSLFPCKEDLEERFQSLNDLNNLKAFIKGLREDLKEAELFGGNHIFSFYQDDLNQLYEHILKAKKNKPHYSQNDNFHREEHNKLRRDITEFVESQVKLKNVINEFSNWKQESKINWKQGSKIVKKQEFDMIKKWLPSNQPFNPILIYSSSRDGANPASFHKFCDGKKNTISLLKVIFDGSDKPCILGGFLDKPWSSKAEAIESQSAFIFSITSNISCPIMASHHETAAVSDPNYGPVFGLNPDLCTPINNKGFMDPKSYTGSNQLVQSKSYQENGKIEFKTVEVEVYSID